MPSSPAKPGAGESYFETGHAVLTNAGALAALGAAQRRAVELGLSVSIAVVDAAGTLVAFSKMDRALIGSVEIAQTKAISAATRRRPTHMDAGDDAIQAIRMAAAGSRVTSLGGGLPIDANGQIVGGIGVSAGTSDENVDVAQAGLNALRAG